ncbi:hypothetical protein Tco_0352558 [Tanacetum coccineum]
MTKQGNFNQRTPQAKKQQSILQEKKQQSDPASKQASRTTNALKYQCTSSDMLFPMTGSLLETTQATTVTTSAEDLQRASFVTPHQMVPGINPIEPPPAPLRNKVSDLEIDNLALEGVAPELVPGDFVSQNYETLATLMQKETKKRSHQSLQTRLNFDPEYEASPPRHQKERREKDSRRPSVFTRIGKKVYISLGLFFYILQTRSQT